jgi:CRP-like cAMP-binding protein
MPSSRTTEDIANRILLSLPEATLERLRPALEFRAMAKGDEIDHFDRPIEYLYFVNRGLISFVKTMQDGRTVEIGVVGIEGISSPHALFGINKAVLEAMVQVPGTAFRITRDNLKRLISEDIALRETLEKYAHFSVAAFAQTTACNRLHHLDERCCRWLLITHDSARSDTFSLTHEFLAMMLGVQRAGVSITANALQRAGLIRYRRGQVTIIDRSGLEDAACECYRAMGIEFDKLFPTHKKSHSLPKPERQSRRMTSITHI